MDTSPEAWNTQDIINRSQEAQKEGRPKKEDQSVDTSVLLRRGNKISTERVTETKCGAGTEGMAVQRLPHIGIHPIYSNQI